MERHGAEVTLVSVAPVNADMVQALNTAAQTRPRRRSSRSRPTAAASRRCSPRNRSASTSPSCTPARARRRRSSTRSATPPKARSSTSRPTSTATAPTTSCTRPIADRYGAKYDYEAQSAGTVSFRATINLYAALRELGADDDHAGRDPRRVPRRGRRAELLRPPLHVRRRAARRLPGVVRAPAVARHG